ncbi:hypothetical protein FOZ61_006184 [Perkinsus olseni]|uniref:Tubulin--tyrosine ligase-like protein 5 n=1 Tax=Perkinsus olseni TaxID=32597 RepID=A0A7J6LES0_PEROL|nr:hypothetical protein FOZ61_006184 [Perkinsus olseni]
MVKVTTPVKKQESLSPETTADVGDSNNGCMVRQQLATLGFGAEKMKAGKRFAKRTVWVWRELRQDALAAALRHLTRSEIPSIVLVNKLQKMPEFGSKCGLVTAVRRSLESRSAGKECSWLPETYILPEENKSASGAVMRSTEETCWIVKPASLNRGMGIKILDRKSSLEYLRRPPQGRSPKGVIQRYLSEPLLLDGRKCDLRMYLLITRTEPLKAYFARGYVRRTLAKYSENISDRPAHLTNQAVQKKLGGDYETRKQESTWSILQLCEYLASTSPGEGGDADWWFNSWYHNGKEVTLFPHVGVVLFDVNCERFVTPHVTFGLVVGPKNRPWVSLGLSLKKVASERYVPLMDQLLPRKGFEGLIDKKAFSFYLDEGSLRGELILGVDDERKHDGALEYVEAIHLDFAPPGISIAGLGIGNDSKNRIEVTSTWHVEDDGE